MKVIQHGMKKLYVKDPVLFFCADCGCIFEETRDNVSVVFFDDAYFTCNCPDCSHLAATPLGSASARPGKGEASHE